MNSLTRKEKEKGFFDQHGPIKLYILNYMHQDCHLFSMPMHAPMSIFNSQCIVF